MKSAAVIVLVCGTAVAAWAGPTFTNVKNAKATQSRPPTSGSGGATDSMPFSDNFDSYANGSALTGQGGWVRWDPAASVDGVVSNAQSVSAANSFKLVPQTDQVQTGTAITSGKWELKCKTYYPSTNVAPGVNDGAFIIGLNRFISGGVGMGNDYWSAQAQWVGTNPPVVRNYDLQTQSTPMVQDQWVDFKLVIDLATDKYDAYYNGVNFITQRSWSQGTATPGQISITAFDFYCGNLATTVPFEFFVDNVSLTQVTSCYPNCDQSTSSPLLTANDFQCFLNEYAAGSSYANCDASTSVPLLTANDFQCFLNAFAGGCS